MEIQIYKRNADLYIKVIGRIVLDECEILKKNAISMIDRDIHQVHLDLADVEFIDSAGLGVLVGLKMTTNKQKSRLILVAPSKGVHDILYVSKLDSIFDIVTGSEAQGVRSNLVTDATLIRSLGKEPTPSSESRPTKEMPVSAIPTLKSPTSGAFSGEGAGFNIPSRNPVQEPAPFGAESAPKGTASSEEDVRDRVDRQCRDAVDFMRQGDYDRACECYLSAIELDPEYLPAHNNLAIVYEKKPAWHQKAIEQWERVLRISQKSNDQKHIERASKHLDNLRRL